MFKMPIDIGDLLSDLFESTTKMKTISFDKASKRKLTHHVFFQY